MLRVIVSVALLAMLEGCAATDTKMVNNKGQTAECSAFGAGIIGTVAALAVTKNCVDKRKAEGFREVPDKTASTDQQTK
jgi:hypothetical protein